MPCKSVIHPLPPNDFNSRTRHFKIGIVVVSKKWGYKSILVIERIFPLILDSVIRLSSFLPFVFWHFVKNIFCKNDKVPKKVFEKTKIEALFDSRKSYGMYQETVSHCFHLFVKLFHVIWHVCMRIFLANNKDIPNRDDSKIFQTEGGKYWPQGRCGKKAGSPFKPWIFWMWVLTSVLVCRLEHAHWVSNSGSIKYYLTFDSLCLLYWSIRGRAESLQF